MGPDYNVEYCLRWETDGVEQWQPTEIVVFRRRPIGVELHITTVAFSCVSVAVVVGLDNGPLNGLLSRENPHQLLGTMVAVVGGTVVMVVVVVTVSGVVAAMVSEPEVDILNRMDILAKTVCLNAVSVGCPIDAHDPIPCASLHAQSLNPYSYEH